MAGTDASSVPSVCATRATLLARCGDDSPPGAWRGAAASAGVTGADAFLCYLSRSIVGALERLAASAEAARARVGAARMSGDIGSQPHCNELESCVELTEASKRVALEHELCAVDAALEHLRAERSTASDVAASLCDSELEAELTARLDAADAQLLALPTTVVEIPHVGVAVDSAALLAGAAVFGRVVAPLAITAADLTLEGAPHHTWPGDTVRLYLVLHSAAHAAQTAEELAVSLGAAAAATHVEATLKAEGAAPQPLQADVSADNPKRCIIISIGVPLDAPVGSSVCFGPLTMSGQPVAGLLGPLVVKVWSVSHAKT